MSRDKIILEVKPYSQCRDYMCNDSLSPSFHFTKVNTCRFDYLVFFIGILIFSDFFQKVIRLIFRR